MMNINKNAKISNLRNIRTNSNPFRVLSPALTEYWALLCFFSITMRFLFMAIPVRTPVKRHVAKPTGGFYPLMNRTDVFMQIRITGVAFFRIASRSCVLFRAPP